MVRVGGVGWAARGEQARLRERAALALEINAAIAAHAERARISRMMEG